MHSIAQGLVAGLGATACMTLLEFFFYRRYGLEGALDWHINQCALSRINGRPPDENLVVGLVIHGAVGGAAGIGFQVIASNLTIDRDSIWLCGVVFGVTLWLMLLPLRRPLTGLAPFGGRLRFIPAAASLVGHVIFGVVLGFFMTRF